jgi:hypothetical protein
LAIAKAAEARLRAERGVEGQDKGALPELNIDLEVFEREGRLLEIRVSWLDQSLWFVPSMVNAEGLIKLGVSRSCIWTARELRELLAISDLTADCVWTVATAKSIFVAIPREHGG